MHFSDEKAVAADLVNPCIECWSDGYWTTDFDRQLASGRANLTEYTLPCLKAIPFLLSLDVFYCTVLLYCTKLGILYRVVC